MKAMQPEVERLASTMMLGALLDAVRERHKAYEVLAHWTQGEFHHDVVLRVDDHVLVVATNCNGGVKEVIAFPEAPERWALWHWRCPNVADFSGDLRPEARQRQVGGGWERKGCS